VLAKEDSSRCLAQLSDDRNRSLGPSSVADSGYATGCVNIGRVEKCWELLAQ
jgi:hypothetical protein